MNALIKDDGQTKLSKWGNSSATRIPAKMIEELGWKDNENLAIKIEHNTLVLKPISKRPTDIHELFAGWQDDGKKDTEMDWGRSQGHEVKW